MKKKSIALLVSLVLLLTVTVGATLAFLIDSTDPVENTFNPSKVTTTVVEELDGNVKKNVKIQNTGDTTAYIRAAVIVTWQDKDGNVYGTAPAAGDYSITFNTDDQTDSAGKVIGKWTLADDGFYYWSAPVAPDATTGILITSAEAIADKTSEGYFLNIEILGSGIQSVPTSVVTTEWSSGVSGVNNTTLTIKVPDNNGGEG